MKKMPCLFRRDFTDPRAPKLLHDISPGCEFVLEGRGVASRKRDGTACAVIGGRLFKRLDVKRGKTQPPGAIPCDDPDETTGHWPHWIAVGAEADSRWHREAWEGTLVDGVTTLPDGTYELCGPKIGSNKEGLDEHVFFEHGGEPIPDPPRDFDAIRAYLEANAIEGIVFAEYALTPTSSAWASGQRCKIRRADFGIPWPPSGVSLAGR